jgi:hypothetical protein
MTKPTRVIPEKAGILPWGHDQVGRKRPVVESAAKQANHGGP